MDCYIVFYGSEYYCYYDCRAQVSGFGFRHQVIIIPHNFVRCLANLARSVFGMRCSAESGIRSGPKSRTGIYSTHCSRNNDHPLFAGIHGKYTFTSNVIVTGEIYMIFVQ